MIRLFSFWKPVPVPAIDLHIEAFEKLNCEARELGDKIEVTKSKLVARANGALYHAKK